MVTPIIRHITAEGKALRKASNNEVFPSATDSTTAGDGIDLTNIDSNYFDPLVRQILLRSF